MLKMVDGTGIIGVDMVCPLGGTVSPPQPPNFDKVEMEGVGSLTLPNSLKAPLERVELIGNSAQLTTTGKNLFDIKKASDVSNYITTETLAKIDISAAIVFDVKKNTNYCLSVSGKTDQPSINFNIANDVQRKSIFNKLKTEETLNSLDSGKIYVGFSGGDTELNATKLSQEYFDIQLEEASSKTPYEPYTGGKPSPSPEYPQEIKNVGKWNEEKQKYEIDVKVTNSEQGWTEEQTLTLTSDRLLTKWDKLVEQDGQIGWLYGSKIYVVTGNEIFEYRSGYDQDAYTNRFIVINDLFVNRLNDKQLAYCKILKRVQYIYAQNKLEEGIDTNINQLHIKLSNDRIGVLSSDDTETRTAKIAEYIKNTYTDGIEILYATTDTVFLPLSESEQTQLRNLHSYNGTTNITVDSGEVPCGIKLTYRKEI